MNLLKTNKLLKKKIKILQAKKFKTACKNYVRVFEIYSSLRDNKQINKESLKVNVVKLAGLLTTVLNVMYECYNEGIEPAYELIANLENLQEEMQYTFSKVYDDVNNFINSILNEGGNYEKQ